MTNAPNTKTGNDGWALVPEDGRPSRLIRFGQLYDGMLASYSPAVNILFVDRGYYDALSSIDQGRVLITHTDLWVTVRGDHVTIEN